ncbi:MAG: hypothetical protein K8H88_19815 [Sandaracinaceae bacterium]|nr:hypothetical protein [Sandaracinaceae bacterium]
MSARVVTVLERKDFDFLDLAAGVTAQAPIRLGLPLGIVGRAVMVVRVHAATLTSGSSFRVDARAEAPTEEDPAQFFRGPIVATAVVTSSSVSVPQAITCPLAGPSASLSFFLSATQSKPAGGIKFAISVDVLVADAMSEWTPLDLSSVTLWLDERDLVRVGELYSDWGDQSPLGNDFTQGTSSLRPKSGLSINDRPAPDFDGSDDSMAASALSSFVPATQYHTFVVLRAESISGTNATSYLNDGVIADGGAGWWGIYLRTSAGVPEVLAFHWGGGDRYAVGTGLVLGQDTLVEASFDGATIRCQVSGEPIGTQTAGAIGDLTNAVKLGNGAAAVYFDGVIASVIVCKTYLGTAERAAVRAYLSSKYGVAA